MASGLGMGLEWRKSSWCNGGTCVEIAVQGDAILVRSSADQDGPVLAISPTAWRDLIAGIRRMSLAACGRQAPVLGRPAYLEV